MYSDLVVEKVIEIPVTKDQLHKTAPNQPGFIAETVVLMVFVCAAVGAIATFITKEFHHKKAEHDLKGQLSKIPCPNCQYFSKSSYLRCAVHPKVTMTTEAQECPDFTPEAKKTHF